jgi:hypothetical protein
MNRIPLHKQWSAWLITAMGILTAIEPFIPQLQALLPEAWQVTNTWIVY